MSTVPTRTRSLTTLAAASSALCLASGAAYLTVSPTELPVAVLATFGFLGACALLGTGLWQRRAGTESRRLALTTLGVLAAGYAGASGLGFAGARIARTARLEPTGLPIALHVAGIAAGAILLVAVLAELLRQPRRKIEPSAQQG